MKNARIAVYLPHFYVKQHFLILNSIHQWFLYRFPSHNMTDHVLVCTYDKAKKKIVILILKRRMSVIKIAVCCHRRK